MLTFNNAIQVFPAVLVAGVLGFTKREFFEIEDAAEREVPRGQLPRSRRAAGRRTGPLHLRAMRRRRRAASALARCGARRARRSPAPRRRSRSRCPRRTSRCRSTKDGSLVVDELITYAFSGPFTGGYRDIPLRPGESIDDVQVREAAARYRPGGCTELGCADAPGTFG